MMKSFCVRQQVGEDDGVWNQHNLHRQVTFKFVNKALLVHNRRLSFSQFEVIIMITIILLLFYFTFIQMERTGNLVTIKII